MEYSHSCIKCGVVYKDTDPDPYYCEKCYQESRIIAKRIEKKLLNKKPTRPTRSALQEYDEAPKFGNSKFIIGKL